MAGGVMGSRGLLLVVCCLHMFVVTCGYPQSEQDPFQVKLFSSLQDDEGLYDYLYPYPAGAHLKMMCQVYGSSPSWWEWDQKLCPNSTLNRDTGISSVEFYITSLTSKDHARHLTCTSNGNRIKPATVALYVVDKMPNIKIHHIRAPGEQALTVNLANKSTTIGVPAHSLTRFSCSAARMDPALKLCWFRDGRRIGCQARPPKSTESLENTLPVELGGSDVGSSLVCKPQLRQEPVVLKPEARLKFEEMFESARREVDVQFADDLKKLKALQLSMAAQDGTSDINAMSQTEEVDSGPCGPLTCDGSRSEQSYCLTLEVNSSVVVTAPEEGVRRTGGYMIATILPSSAEDEDTDNKQENLQNCDHNGCVFSGANSDHKSLLTPQSVEARNLATVATGVSWLTALSLGVNAVLIVCVRQLYRRIMAKKAKLS